MLIFLNCALIERSVAGDTWEVNKEALSVNSPAIAATDELEFTKKKTSAVIHCF